MGQSYVFWNWMDWDDWYEEGFTQEEVEKVMDLKRRCLALYVQELIASKNKRGLGAGKGHQAQKEGSAAVKAAPWQDFTKLFGFCKLDKREVRSLLERYATGAFSDFAAFRAEAENLRRTAPGTLYFAEQLHKMLSEHGGLELKASGKESEGVEEAQLMRAAAVGGVDGRVRGGRA